MPNEAGNEFMKTAFFTFLLLTPIMMQASATEQEYVIPPYTPKDSLSSLMAQNKKYINDILQQLTDQDDRARDLVVQNHNKEIKPLPKKSNAKIGMTTSQILHESNWGKPKDINTTINAYGKFEQWVYGLSQYLYFTNGKLTSIQY